MVMVLRHSLLCVLFLSAACFAPFVVGQNKQRQPDRRRRTRARQLQAFQTLCADLDTVPPQCSSLSTEPSCWAATSPAYCSAEHSFDALIDARTTAARNDPNGALSAGFWFHLLEDKGGAYVHTAEQGFLPPTIHCCVTSPTDLTTDSGCAGVLSSSTPVVIKATDSHSNNGVFAFNGALSSGINSTEMITSTDMTLEDVITALEAMNPSKIIVEDLILQSGGGLPTEYKFHMFDGQVAAVDIVMNRGTGCDCYAVIDMNCVRLDQQGCFKTMDGIETLDADSCVAVNGALGMRRTGPVKNNLPICGDIDFDTCLLSQMAEIASGISQTIGVYVRVDMFADQADNLYVQEFSTNHMGGYRYCASRIDPDTGCLDPCYLGEMWESNGSNQLYGGDSSTVPAYLSAWLTLTAEEQCDVVKATSPNPTFIPSACTAKTTSSPTSTPTSSPTVSPVVGATPSPTTKPTLAPTVQMAPLSVVGENITMDPSSTFPDIAFDTITDPVVFWSQSGPIGPCFAVNGDATAPGPSDSLTVVDPSGVTDADIGTGGGTPLFPMPSIDAIGMAISALQNYDLQTVTQMVNTITDGTDFGTSTDAIQNDLQSGAFPPYPTTFLQPPDGSTLSNVVCADPPFEGMGITNAPTVSPTYSPTSNSPTTSPTSAPTCADTLIDVSGVVYQDLDVDGTLGIDDPGTNGDGLITVTAYDNAGSIVGTANVNTDGTYVLQQMTANTCNDEGVTIVLDVPWYLCPTVAGPSNSTPVKFYASTANDADFGIIDVRRDDCEANAPLSVSCYVAGNQTSGTDTIVNFTAPDIASVRHMAYDTETGSVWGLTYDRTEKVTYGAAFLKRHVGFGEGGVGIDTIYKIENGDTTSVWTRLSSLFISVGNAPTDRDLGAKTEPSRDTTAFTYTMIRGIGDIELDMVTKTMWIVNLEDRNLYGIQNTRPDVSPNSTDVVGPYPISASTISCNLGVFRPFGIKVYRGHIYAGGVCTGESGSVDINDVTGHVLRMDLQNPGTFVEVLSWDFNYPRRGGEFWGITAPVYWKTWFQCTPMPGFCQHPIVTGIEFDNEGAMIVGVNDRWGHVGGANNIGPVDNGDFTLRSVNAEGDLLRACPSGSGTWIMEGLSSCPQHVTNGTGINGGEYFHREREIVGSLNDYAYHHETAMGAMAYYNGDIVATSMDPDRNLDSGGIRWYDATSAEITGMLELYHGAGTFGKANGLGDLELSCQRVGIEVGNYVWCDADEDGFQDAHESGIPDVSVTLVDMGPAPAAAPVVVQTNANGNYVFGEADVGVDGLQPFRNYCLQVDPASLSSCNQVTIADVNGAAGDEYDSDADGSSGTPQICFTTGPDGCNSFQYDFGFHY